MRGPVRSTQQNEFSLSMTQKSFMDLDEKGILNSTLDSQKTSLLFRVGPSQSGGGASQSDITGSLADFRRSGKKLKRVHGADRGGIKSGGAAPDRRVYVEGESVARRFDATGSGSSGESTQETMIAIASTKRRYQEVWEARRKQARQNTVTLYREYKTGELPDIMIMNKDLLLPLQHLTSADPVIARQMFLLIFGGVYRDLPRLYEEGLATALQKDIRGQLTRILTTTGGGASVVATPSSPSFIFAIHLAHLRIATIEDDMHAAAAAKAKAAVIAAADAKDAKSKSRAAAAADKKDRTDLLPLFAYEMMPDKVGETAYRSTNYHSGIILLEHLLSHPAGTSVKPKLKSGVDTTKDRSEDVWFELARLYRELGEHDIVKSLFHKYARQNYTKDAIQASLK